MNGNDKFRFHMGCGEPLQCRRLVARPVRAQSAAQQDERTERSRSRLSATPREGKCK
ncbi:MAG: hypothetical protein J5I92_15890 [Thiogranum sp.]|nr:hypothetical protein [Thiogranum sp.]